MALLSQTAKSGPMLEPLFYQVWNRTHREHRPLEVPVDAFMISLPREEPTVDLQPLLSAVFIYSVSYGWLMKLDSRYLQRVHLWRDSERQ
jgi:hypothetical protein